jgi:hypothetical protein
MLEAVRRYTGIFCFSHERAIGRVAIIVSLFSFRMFEALISE